MNFVRVVRPPQDQRISSQPGRSAAVRHRQSQEPAAGRIGEPRLLSLWPAEERMRPVFADTSYYLALVNPLDPWHERDVRLRESLLGGSFVSEYVLVELGSALSRGADRLVYLELLERLQSDRSTTIIPASTALFRKGIALFGKRRDKDWSLVDCISIVVMKERRLKGGAYHGSPFRSGGLPGSAQAGGRWLKSDNEEPPSTQGRDESVK